MNALNIISSCSIIPFVLGFLIRRMKFIPLIMVNKLEMNYARIYPQARSFHAIHNCSIRTGYSFYPLLYLFYLYLLKREKLFIMKKEKSWSVNVPKLFAINILFTGLMNLIIILKSNYFHRINYRYDKHIQ